MVFGAGHYRPETNEGRRLLAHELTHVVQQSANPFYHGDLSLGAAEGNHEEEAERAARSLFSPSHDGTPSIGVNAQVCTPIRSRGSAPAGMVQRQILFPIGTPEGGGISGVYEREHYAAFATLYPPGWRPTMHTIKVWFNAFIPMAQVKGPPFHDCFRGDNRGFSNAIHASSRTHQEIEFNVTTFAKTIDWKDTRTSHEVDCKTGAVERTKKAPMSEMTNGGVVPDAPAHQINVDFQVSASNPLVWEAPAIDADVVFHIDPFLRRCTLTGKHDGFPAYEAYVTADGGAGHPVYTYDPRKAGEGIWALFPPMDKTVSGTGTSF